LQVVTSRDNNTYTDRSQAKKQAKDVLSISAKVNTRRCKHPITCFELFYSFADGWLKRRIKEGCLRGRRATRTNTSFN
jgi:hypothetical protein